MCKKDFCGHLRRNGIRAASDKDPQLSEIEKDTKLTWPKEVIMI